MDLLYNKIQEIKNEPYKYIEKKRLKYLFNYIVGYSRMQDRLKHTGTYILDYFARFLKNYYTKNKLKWSLLHWSDQIILLCGSDEEAFDYFYDFLEMYLIEQKIDPYCMEEQYTKTKDFSIYNVFFDLKKRYGIFLGLKNLVFLKIFLDGYIAAYNDIYNENIVLLPGFQEFVQERFEIKLNRNWADIITFYCNNDEKAFDMFFNLLEEFWQNDKELLSLISECNY